jgi:hypothetical protein
VAIVGVVVTGYRLGPEQVEPISRVSIVRIVTRCPQGPSWDFHHCRLLWEDRDNSSVDIIEKEKKKKKNQSLGVRCWLFSIQLLGLVQRISAVSPRLFFFWLLSDSPCWWWGFLGLGEPTFCYHLLILPCSPQPALYKELNHQFIPSWYSNGSLSNQWYIWVNLICSESSRVGQLQWKVKLNWIDGYQKRLIWTRLSGTE